MSIRVSLGWHCVALRITGRERVVEDLFELLVLVRGVLGAELRRLGVVKHDGIHFALLDFAKGLASLVINQHRITLSLDSGLLYRLFLLTFFGAQLI